MLVFFHCPILLLLLLLLLHVPFMELDWGIPCSEHGSTFILLINWTKLALPLVFKAMCFKCREIRNESPYLAGDQHVKNVSNLVLQKFKSILPHANVQRLQLLPNIRIQLLFKVGKSTGTIHDENFVESPYVGFTRSRSFTV